MSKINSDWFFKFETENKLFEIKDENGFPVWDIVRYHLYYKILNKHTAIELNKGKPLIANVKRKHQYVKTFFKVVRNDFRVFLSSYRTSRFFCYLNSRNLINGEFVDQNQIDALYCLDLTQSVAIECLDRFDSYRKHGLFREMFGLPVLLLKISRGRHFFDFTPIMSLIESEFGRQDFDESTLLSYYKSFYGEYNFYKWFFKKKKIAGVFLTLNCLQKGMMAACRELSIPLFEFQHAVVNRELMTYSYPCGELSDNVIVPNVMFSFSPHWFKNFSYPNEIDIVPVGNNYFYGTRFVHQDNKSIVVISNYRDGQLLKNFLLDCLKDEFWSNFTFYFKLHPEQFYQHDYFVDVFKAYNNVKVITNSMNVPQLVKECASMFLIQSTSTYEALQRGAKVYLYKRIDYYQQCDVFEEPNVYIIDNPEDFKKVILNKYVETGKDFFAPFNAKLFVDTVNKYVNS